MKKVLLEIYTKNFYRLKMEKYGRQHSCLLDVVKGAQLASFLVS